MLNKLFMSAACLLVAAAAVIAQEPPAGGMAGGPPPDMGGAGGPPPDMGGGGGPPPDMGGGPMSPPSGVNATSGSTSAVAIVCIQPRDLAELRARLAKQYPEQMASIEAEFATANRLAAKALLDLAAKAGKVPVSAFPARDSLAALHRAETKIAARFPNEYAALVQLRAADPSAARAELLRLYRALPEEPSAEPATAAAPAPAAKEKKP